MPTAAKKITAPQHAEEPLTLEELERWKKDNAKHLKPARHAGRPVSLATLRKGAGLSQAEVAERMGVAQSHVSKVEGGGELMLATLRRYVESIGAELELRVVVKGGGSWRLKP